MHPNLRKMYPEDREANPVTNISSRTDSSGVSSTFIPTKVPPNQSKYKIACKACREFKKRCDHADGDAFSTATTPCRRCQHLSITCVPNTPLTHQRGRPKRGSSRLDRIERLFNNLQEQVRSEEEQKSWKSGSEAQKSLTGQAYHHLNDHEIRLPIPIATKLLDGQKTIRVDDLLSEEDAARFLQHYDSSMTPYMPAVYLPPGTSLQVVHKEKPFLLLSILTVATSCQRELQQKLIERLLYGISEAVIVLGQKNIDIVQALQVAVLWHWPTERISDMTAYQFVQMAVSIMFDLGFDEKYDLSRDLQTACGESLEIMEARRAWLVCYILASHQSIALCRPHLLPRKLTQRSLQDLKSFHATLHIDKILCDWASAYVIIEEAFDCCQAICSASTTSGHDQATFNPMSCKTQILQRAVIDIENAIRLASYRTAEEKGK